MLHYQQQIELNAAFDVDALVLSLAHLLALNHGLLDDRLEILHASQIVEIVQLEMSGPIQ